MSNRVLPLCELPLGYFGKVCELLATDNTRRRLLDLGLVANTLVEALRKSPSGDPTAYQIRGAVIALRADEASRIMVEVEDKWG
jgi:ferrous iron transport protein A